MSEVTVPITKETKMHLYFDFNATFKALKSYIDNYNRQHPKLKEKVNAGHRATAELMIRLYLKQVNGFGKLEPLSLAEMPALRTYNSSLAACKGCTSRTIFNHKERLKQAGVIMCEKQHGGEGLDLWINPEIMWKGACKAQKIAEGGYSYTPVYDQVMENRKNIPPLVQELQEQNNINSNVENKGVRLLADKCGWPGGNAFTGAFDKSTRKNTCDLSADQAKDAETTALNAGFLKKNGADQTTGPGKMPHPCPPGEQQEQHTGGAGRVFHPGRENLLLLVQEFWAYARKVLYPNLKLSQPEERDILNMVYASVYGKFRLNYTQKEWEQYHDTAIVRLNMVRKWLDRSPGRWIPAPELYFSPHNEKNSFKKTWNWYVKQETLKLQVQNQLEVQKMLHELKQHGEGKGRHSQKSRYELFLSHKKRLDRIGDNSLQEMYLLALQRSASLNTNSYA